MTHQKQCDKLPRRYDKDRCRRPGKLSSRSAGLAFSGAAGAPAAAFLSHRKSEAAAAAAAAAPNRLPIVSEQLPAGPPRVDTRVHGVRLWRRRALPQIGLRPPLRATDTVYQRRASAWERRVATQRNRGPARGCWATRGPPVPPDRGGKHCTRHAGGEVRCARPAPAAALACLMRGQASPEVSPWQRQHIDSEGAAQLGSLAGAVCPRPQPPPSPAPPGWPVARPSAVALSPPAPSPCSAPDVLRTRALSPLAAVMREVALRQYSRRGAAPEPAARDCVTSVNSGPICRRQQAPRLARPRLTARNEQKFPALCHCSVSSGSSAI
ncbi:keratinocyte proline-rich protein-like [Schistocerca gregaria]|uniref:keratinocyte proline-rich protein-like n=1 Tax=Schistocerca gregaria TaxID=7010 RepID=UPI00211EDFD9|nr:keratinocyte proline-rich protein-like [Schistocerca gregaria]